jgi:hypothetical protein
LPLAQLPLAQLHLAQLHLAQLHLAQLHLAQSPLARAPAQSTEPQSRPPERYCSSIETFCRHPRVKQLNEHPNQRFSLVEGPPIARIGQCTRNEEKAKLPMSLAFRKTIAAIPAL